MDTTRPYGIHSDEFITTLAARYLAPEERAAFDALDRRKQLYRLASRCHAKRQYAMRDACEQAARALLDR